MGVLRLNNGMAPKPQYGEDRLVNKRTGKLASSSTWLLDLAACAVVGGDYKGIPALLPQNKAKKLLIHNELKKFKRHKSIEADSGQESSHAALRVLACKALPTIAVFYIQNAVGNRLPSQVNKKGFRGWLMSQLAIPDSALNIFLKNHTEFSALAELKRADNWWLDLQKQRVNP